MNVKSDFLIFNEIPNLVYFDSASTTLVPKVSVKTTTDFLNSITASARRGAHKLAVRGSTIVEETRQSLSKYLETEPASLSFQKSIPSAVASFMYGYNWKKNGKNNVIIAQSEDNSILVSILRAAEVLQLDIELIPVDKDGSLSLTTLEKLIDDKTGIVAVGHTTPGIGVVNPISEIAEITHSHDAVLLTDTTRLMGFTKNSPVFLGSDILVFSGNIGLMGPPGLAIQWINPSIEKKHIPGILGGSSVTDVDMKTYTVAFQPDKYESGYLNVPAIAGLGTSIKYITNLYTNGLLQHISDLSKYMRKRLVEIDSLTLYGRPREDTTIFGFNIGDSSVIGSHDIALFLDESNIAVRSGLVCAHSLMQSVAKEGLIQVSIHAYNSFDDIDNLVNTIDIISKQLI